MTPPSARLSDLSRLATGSINILLDAIPDPMVVTDVEGTILRVSKSAAQLLGYPPTKLEGRSLADLISKELRDDYTRHRMAFVASGADTGPELETWFMTAREALVPIDSSVGRLNVDGATYVVLVMREVSDRLATQNRLERLVAIDELTTSISSWLNTPDFDAIDQMIEVSIHELASFCEANAVYLYTEDKNGSFSAHSQSPGSEEHGGLSKVGVQRLPWVRALLDRGMITEVKTDQPPSPEAEPDCLRLQAEGVTSMVVIPFRAAGHTIGFAAIESTDPLRPAWPGQDLAGLVVLQDVFENALERRRIGSELRRANRVLQAVSECHDALIRAQDEKEMLSEICRIVVEAGGYAMAWVGYAMDDASQSIKAQAQWGEGRDFVRSLDLTWADEGEALGPAGRSIRTRRPFTVQDTSVDQEIRWHGRPYSHGFLSLVAIPMFYEDEVAGVLGVYDKQAGAFDAPEVKVLQRFADDLAFGIAALRARERQREAESQLIDLLKSKDDLIATIAHELRTPLAGVVGFAELLRDEAESLDPESRAEMIRLVAEQGMDLTNIVDDLLVAAKWEAGTLVMASVRVDLRAQAAQVLEAWGSDVATRIEFTGEPAISVGDPARVRQILRNLVSNALRYGGDRIHVRVGSHEDTVYAAVEDDGHGVAPGEQETIFEPYQRAHDAPGLTASMGLGLSISRQLAQMMGGDLAYERRGDLSVFTLSMRSTEPASGSD